MFSCRIETFTKREHRKNKDKEMQGRGNGCEEGKKKKKRENIEKGSSQQTALTVLHPTTNYYIVSGSFEAQEPLRGT